MYVPHRHAADRANDAQCSAGPRACPLTLGQPAVYRNCRADGDEPDPTAVPRCPIGPRPIWSGLASPPTLLATPVNAPAVLQTQSSDHPERAYCLTRSTGAVHGTASRLGLKRASRSP